MLLIRLATFPIVVFVHRGLCMNNSQFTVVVVGHSVGVSVEQTASGVAKGIGVFSVDCVVADQKILIAHAQWDAEHKSDEKEDN